MRKLFFISLACLAQALVPAWAAAQYGPSSGAPVLAWVAAEPSSAGNNAPPANALLGSSSTPGSPNLVNITPLPRMAPELALGTFEERLERQPLALAAYSATQVIAADLPDTRQKGEWELERRYVAPRTLEFKPLKFIGDAFVKTNVIARLLKSEVEHIQKDDPSSTALTPVNYKFKYKGVEDVDGQAVHVFEVKPRKKRPGLIKGRIYLDVHTGGLRRVAGELAKSPSFFVKKLEFVQDYADIGGFSFPVHTRSVAKTRIVGRALVEITTRDYTPVPAASAAVRPSLVPISLAVPTE